MQSQRQQSKRSEDLVIDWSNRLGKLGKVIDNPFTYFNSTNTLKKVNEWIKRHKDLYDLSYVRMHHGTGVNVPVLDKGLLPTSHERRRSFQSQSGYVYLATNPELAKTFGDLGNCSNSVVYEVLVRVDKLLPDLDQIRNKRGTGDSIGKSLANSLLFCQCARVKGKIDLWQIQKLEIQP